MVTSAPARPRTHELQRFSLGPLIVLLVVVAVLFGIAGTRSQHYETLIVAAFVGLNVGFFQGLLLGRGARSMLVQALIGLVVALASAKLLLGEANLQVAVAGGALILGTALVLRVMRTLVSRAQR